MERKNCWEMMKCGRESGGTKIKEFGICPAAISREYNSINRGENGGRYCWAIAGTFCGEKIQGAFADKLLDCVECDFFKQVNKDEGRDFILTPKNAENELNQKKRKRNYE